MSSIGVGPEVGPKGGSRDRVVLAVILIAVGGVGLFTQFVQPTTDVGGWIVLVIGLALMGAFTMTRQYGFLIPAGIMTGLGTGIIVSELVNFANKEATGGLVVLGLGLGFLSIWAIGSLTRVEQNHWWPVIPGGILTIVGGALLIGSDAVAILDYWGVAVIAVGLFLLWRAFATRQADSPG